MIYWCVTFPFSLFFLFLINYFCFLVAGAEWSWEQEVFGGRVSKPHAYSKMPLFSLSLLVSIHTVGAYNMVIIFINHFARDVFRK